MRSWKYQWMPCKVAHLAVVLELRDRKENHNLITIDLRLNKITSAEEPVSDPTFMSTVFSGLWTCPSLTAGSSPRKPRAVSQVFSVEEAEAEASVEGSVADSVVH